MLDQCLLDAFDAPLNPLVDLLGHRRASRGSIDSRARLPLKDSALRWCPPVAPDFPSAKSNPPTVSQALAGSSFLGSVKRRSRDDHRLARGFTFGLQPSMAIRTDFDRAWIPADFHPAPQRGAVKRLRSAKEFQDGFFVEEEFLDDLDVVFHRPSQSRGVAKVLYGTRGYLI